MNENNELLRAAKAVLTEWDAWRTEGGSRGLSDEMMEAMRAAIAVAELAQPSEPAPADKAETHLLPSAPWRSRSTDRQFDGYYIHFDTTGVDVVDEVLRAVAFAGKAYHDIEGWSSGTKWLGKTCAEWIQDAARNAADAMRRSDAALRGGAS